MGEDAKDKAGRLLSIYSRLKQGKVINKQEESHRYGVTMRTIQRDITDVQCFLEEHVSVTGEIQEIIYDKTAGGYVLQTKKKMQLEEKELLAVAKILLESRALIKEELYPIIDKLIHLCSNDLDAKLLEEMLQNEKFHYVELQHKKPLLDKIWKLEEAVKSQQYLEIEYQKLKQREIVTRKIKPVGVIFSEFYFYLVAYIEDIDKEKVFQNPNDTFPTIYRVDRLKSIKMLKEHFAVPYKERFEEGEFRKRIQFMYGGRLQKVKFRYSGTDIDAILDRLPTAQILGEKDGVYTVAAEVFGNGIDMWMRSQGENITIISRDGN